MLAYDVAPSQLKQKVLRRDSIERTVVQAIQDAYVSVAEPKVYTSYMYVGEELSSRKPK